MSEQQPLNGAQIQAVQEHLQKLVADVSLRKWVIESVLANTNRHTDAKELVTLCEQVYAFVAKPIEPKSHN